MHQAVRHVVDAMSKRTVLLLQRAGGALALR
jgi:hypothetical protein